MKHSSVVKRLWRDWCPQARRGFKTLPGRSYVDPADQANWRSLLDKPPTLVRINRRHGPGLIVLALIPITAFALGTWQVQRLEWKSKLIAEHEDKLVRDPLPLPPRIDTEMLAEFDYRRVYASGRYRHDQEMLIGPRIRDGENGYLVITPLERDGRDSKILVSRGWISKKLQKQTDRSAAALPAGEVVVHGLLRKPLTKNMFTPDNKPEEGQFYFPDIEQMARWTASQPVWVEETFEPDYAVISHRSERGIPIGREAAVALTNNHLQYIFTWYALGLATSYMFWLVVRKPPTSISRRVRMSSEWANR